MYNKKNIKKKIFFCVEEIYIYITNIIAVNRHINGNIIIGDYTIDAIGTSDIFKGIQVGCAR